MTITGIAYQQAQACQMSVYVIPVTKIVSLLSPVSFQKQSLCSDQFDGWRFRVRVPAGGLQILLLSVTSRRTSGLTHSPVITAVLSEGKTAGT